MTFSFSPTTPTYVWRTVCPTSTRDYFSDKKLPFINKSTLDLHKDVAKSRGIELQSSHLDLVVTVTIGKAAADQPMTVHVSLEDSVISSGPMFYNQHDKRGYFQDRIDVEMFLSDNRKDPRDDFRRASDGPQTVNGSGATSSSVSVSFSVSGSANAGFFGDTPTGGAGGSASLGVTNSHSFSRNLSDFKAVNTSGQFRIKHHYKMSESTGGAYLSAHDLVPHGDDIGFLEALRKIELYHPPDLATSNLPLISQAAWQATSNREYDEQIHAVIKVTQRVVQVEGTNTVTRVHWQSSTTKVSHTHVEPIPLKPFRVDGGDNAIQL